MKVYENIDIVDAYHHALSYALSISWKIISIWKYRYNLCLSSCLVTCIEYITKIFKHLKYFIFTTTPSVRIENYPSGTLFSMLECLNWLWNSMVDKVKSKGFEWDLSNRLLEQIQTSNASGGNYKFISFTRFY